MIDGAWRMVSGFTEGHQLSAEQVEEAMLVIESGTHTVTLGDDVLCGTHTLDVEASPITIDADDTTGPFAGKPMRGIFKLDRDQLTICFATPGSDRPSEFNTDSGNVSVLHVWKRV